jgi:hypothetical protein
MAATSAPAPKTEPPPPQRTKRPGQTSTTTVQQSAAAKPANAKGTSNPPATQEAAGPSKEELELFQSLQTTALDQRRRAVDAGATPAQLQRGDDYNTAAGTLVQQGKLTDAGTQMSLASTAWSAAERDARASAAAASAAKRRADAPRSESIVVVPPPTAAPVTVQPTAPRAATPDPAAEIRSLVGTYARAIESRDLTQVRRAYPGITQPQADGFDQFFRSVRSVRVNFSVGSLDIKGDAAEAHVSGAYDYINAEGKPQQDPVTFQASFRRDGAAWKLVSVR